MDCMYWIGKGFLDLQQNHILFLCWITNGQTAEMTSPKSVTHIALPSTTWFKLKIQGSFFTSDTFSSWLIIIIPQIANIWKRSILANITRFTNSTFRFEFSSDWTYWSVLKYCQKRRPPVGVSFLRPVRWVKVSGQVKSIDIYRVAKSLNSIGTEITRWTCVTLPRIF